MKYDLHIHSKYSSDGILEPEKIVKVAIKRGLDGVAIVDHNTIKGAVKAKEYETEDFRVIVGCEVMTQRGEVIGLFLSEEVKSRDFKSVVAEIKEQGGIIVIPHPFDGLRHSAFNPAKEDVKFVDAIEGFNSRCVSSKYNEKAVEFALQYNLPVIGGSDAHFANEIGNGGIITDTNDIRGVILENKVKIYGKRSFILNHIGTKMVKAWRKSLNRIDTFTVCKGR
ncbi:MAG TPA: PHP domain-containing protein [Candidatus Atribacteria bacterium]|nr:PHP domain-containing protein [Candidatus Atribacteria bacterium]